MAMRLQEVHPSLVHYPLAFLPTTLACDTLGKLTGSRTLLNIGRYGMAMTAGSVALAGVFGLIAQQEVNARGEAGAMLTTHRNLNLALLGMTTAMAASRIRRKKPTMRYLLTGLGGLGAALYSAYLGGKMVYEHGVGVAAAGGLKEGHAPEITPSTLEEAARHAASDVRDGVERAAKNLAEGPYIPAITAQEPRQPARRTGGASEQAGTRGSVEERPRP